MALRTQQVPIRITGLDTGTDRRWVQPGGLVEAENIVVRTGGVLTKRKGFDPLTTTGMPTSPHTLMRARDALHVVGRDGLSRWDAPSWQSLESPSVLGRISTERVVGLSTTALNLPTEWTAECVLVNGYYVAVGAEGAVRVIERSTGNLMLEEVLTGASAVATTRLAVVGSYVAIVLSVGGTNSTIRASVLDLTGAPSLGSSFVVASDAEPSVTGGYVLFDVCPKDASTAVVVYTETVNKYIKFQEIDCATSSTGTASTSTLAAHEPSTYTSPIGACYHATLDMLLVAYQDGASTAATVIYNYGTTSWTAKNTLPLTTTAPLLSAGICEKDADEWYVAYSSGDITAAHTTEVASIDGSNVDTDVFAVRGGLVVAKPFVLAGGVVVPMGLHDTGASDEYVFTERGVAASYLPANAQGWRRVGFQACSHVVGDVAYWGASESVFAQRVSGQFEYQYAIRLVSFDSDPDSLYAGGGPRVGQLWVDRDSASLETPPMPLAHSLVQGSSGSVNIASGDSYLVRARSKVIDAAGRYHYSRASNAVTFTSSVTDSTASIDLDLAGFGHTVSSPFEVFPVPVDVFRSLPNEQPLYLAKTSSIGLLVSADLEDSDVDVADNSLFPSAELGNDPLPPATSIVRAGERYWAVTSDGEVWYSKLQVQGVGVEWSSVLRVQLPQGATPVAVADMDGIPVVFTEVEVFRVAGIGLDNNGAGGDFAVQRVSADVGCVNALSVVSTPFGIIFQSQRGFRLLDRSFQIARPNGREWGSEADRYAAAPVVRAVQRESEGEVLWFLSNAHTGSDPQVLVYNYEYDFWSTWNLPFTVKDAVLVGDALYTLDTTGTVHAEQSDHYDDGTFVTSAIEFTDLSFAGIEGYQRVRKVILSYRNAENTSADVTFKLAKDDRGGWQQSSLYLVNPANNHRALQCTVRAEVQKCSRLQLRIEETAPSGPGAGDGSGVEIVGIQLEVGVKRGGAKLNRTQR